MTEPLSGDLASQSLNGGGGGGAGPNSSGSGSGVLNGFGFPTTGPHNATYHSDPTILAAWQGTGNGSLSWAVGSLSVSGAAAGFDFSGSVTSASGTFYLHFDYTPVPEPAEWAALGGAGLLGFAFARTVRRRHRQTAL